MAGYGLDDYERLVEVYYVGSSTYVTVYQNAGCTWTPNSWGDDWGAVASVVATTATNTKPRGIAFEIKVSLPSSILTDPAATWETGSIGFGLSHWYEAAGDGWKSHARHPTASPTDPISTRNMHALETLYMTKPANFEQFEPSELRVDACCFEVVH